MKRPFSIVALSYTAGVFLGDFSHPPLSALFVFSLLVGLGALFWNRGRPALLFALLVLSGWTSVNYRTAILSPNDLRNLLESRTEIVSLRGTLAASPSERIFERDQQEMWRSTALVDVEAMARDGQWGPAVGRVSISTPGVLDSSFFAGQKVEVTGVIRPPRIAMAPGLFDSQTFLRRKGIHYQLSATTNDWLALATAPAPTRPLSDRFHAWTKKTLALGLPGEDQPLRLIWTLMLDWKAPMTDAVEEPFMRAGTYHIFAVDGLRIGLISAILIAFFQVLQVPRNISGFAIIPAIWFYAGLTGFPASAVRATIMMSVVLFGWAIRRPGNLLNSLFAAAFLILLWDPQQLFQPGFQLSFLVVLCIALLLPSKKRAEDTAIVIAAAAPPNGWKGLWQQVKSQCETWFCGDPFLPDKFKPRWRRWLFHHANEVFAVSVAAWVGSLPLSAHYFHIFNPVSIPANCIVVPLTMLALISSLASLMVGAWWPLGAELFNHTSWLLMKWITDVSQWFAGWPGACWNVSSPSPVVFATYYIVLLTVVTGWIFRARLKRVILCILAILITLCIGQWWIDSRTVQMHVLPLDGGHAVFIDAIGKAGDLLIDCGNERPAESITKPFLRAQGMNDISRFCISHATAHQMGGFQIVSTNFSVNNFVIGPAKARSPGYRRVTSELEKHPERRQLVQAGDRLGSWSVLHPLPATRSVPADDSPVVLQGAICGHSILLLSDLSRAGQNALLERYTNLQADIVVAGLPTKDEPLCDWLLDTIKPKFIIIADSEFPATRRATEKLRERLTRLEVPVFFCRDTGALTFGFTPRKWSLRRADGALLFESQ